MEQLIIKVSRVLEQYFETKSCYAYSTDNTNGFTLSILGLEFAVEVRASNEFNEGPAVLVTYFDEIEQSQVIADLALIDIEVDAEDIVYQRLCFAVEKLITNMVQIYVMDLLIEEFD